MSSENTTIQLTIDGRTVSVPKGTTVYNAAKQIGIDIPIFCYHDRMPPFGACRMCLVEVEKAPKLQASCTLEAAEGMVVKTQSSPAIAGRKEILELLLINHPLDCPICDRGGECPLQEHVFAYGPGESRFCEEKRHFKKPLPLGPVLMLDRERCIVCARCTRFSDIISGDHALQLLDRGYKSEVGTPDSAPAASKFIGNTIMICPVGALTSQVYRFRARPWDNTPTPSTCTLCPVGCSMTFDSRDGELMRTRSCENRAVNDIWLCDKGWFGYEFTDHPKRLQKPLVRRNGKMEEASWEEALTLVAAKFQAAKSGGKMAAFGGNPLTVEENYLFQNLMRSAGGVQNIDHRIGMSMQSLEDEGLISSMEMSIGATEDLSFAILCGIDLTEEFPVIWLRLRQAINRGAKVFFLGHFAPEIAPYLSEVLLHAPGKEMEALEQHLPRLLEGISNGQKGAIFIGRQYLDTYERRDILAKLWQWREKSASSWSLNILEGSGNSLGARLAGMRPDIGPLGEEVAAIGLDARQVLEAAASGGWDFLYVAGANPANKFPAALWREARAKLGFLVVQDIFMTATARQADVVLPALSFVEKGGSFVNIEGRVQSLLPGKEVPQGLYSDGEIFTLLGQKLGHTLTMTSSFKNSLKEELLPLPRPKDLTPRGLRDSAGFFPSAKEGSLAASFAPALFDGGVRMQHNPHVLQLVKPPVVRIHPQEAAARELQDGDAIRISGGGGFFVAKLSSDARVAAGTLVIPLGFEQLPAQELGALWLNGLPLDITKISSSLHPK